MTIVQEGKKLEIKSPLTGRIVETNSKLSIDASLINKDPFNSGWVYRIEPYNWLLESKSFFMAESYIHWLKNEFTRLRDFLSTRIKHEDPRHLQLVLQDGGELQEGFMEWFGPEFWEEFQVRFINNSK